jgi:hypothetical protein
VRLREEEQRREGHRRDDRGKSGHIHGIPHTPLSIKAGKWRHHDPHHELIMIEIREGWVYS